MFFIHLCQKSLPQLTEQIKTQLWEVKNELKECEAGPPLDTKGAKQFLIKVGSQVITSSCFWELSFGVQATRTIFVLLWFSPSSLCNGSKNILVSEIVPNLITVQAHVHPLSDTRWCYGYGRVRILNYFHTQKSFSTPQRQHFCHKMIIYNNMFM